MYETVLSICCALVSLGILAFTNLLSNMGLPRKGYWAFYTLSAVPIINWLMVMLLSVVLFSDALMGNLKFRNPFKSKKKQSKQSEQSKPTFANLAKDRPNDWISEIYVTIDFPSKTRNELRIIQDYLLSKKSSPYYSGSLLGSLEEMFITWCDEIFTVERSNSRYSGYKCYAKHSILTKQAQEFITEIIESAQIPYDWICQQERNDKDEEVRIRNNRTQQLTDVVKSMKADLERIYKEEVK